MLLNLIAFEKVINPNLDSAFIAFTHYSSPAISICLPSFKAIPVLTLIITSYTFYCFYRRLYFTLFVFPVSSTAPTSTNICIYLHAVVLDLCVNSITSWILIESPLVSCSIIGFNFWKSFCFKTCFKLVSKLVSFWTWFSQGRL